MDKPFLITGAASGIGAALRARLERDGKQVIGVDRRDADIIADLATAAGRAQMVAEAERLAPAGLAGVAAAAGLSEPSAATVAVNYFGAVATLEGLRPLMAKTGRARAVAFASTAALLPSDDGIVEACLAGDEARALQEAQDRPMGTYTSSKRALSLWLRRAAPSAEWAGAGVLLNAVAPGVVLTPMTEGMLQSPPMAEIIAQMHPMGVEGYAQPDEIAELVAFLLGFEGHYLLGQVIFIDGGVDVITRPETY